MIFFKTSDGPTTNGGHGNGDGGTGVCATTKISSQPVTEELVEEYEKKKIDAGAPF